LLLFVDYADHGQGIFADLFGADAARQFVALRTAKSSTRRGPCPPGSGGSSAAIPPSTSGMPPPGQYAELFAALPQPAYLTYGNVDIPKLWGEHLRPGHHVLDGERMELGGWTFGFVGGGLHSPYRTPNEIDDDAYAAKVAAVGAVDVLCSHIPAGRSPAAVRHGCPEGGAGERGAARTVRQTQPR
jgi:hypothetical protein